MFTSVVPPGNAYIDMASNPRAKACECAVAGVKSIRTKYGFCSPWVKTTIKLV